MPLRVRRASVPYDLWRQQGYLNATEGNVTHYGFIEKLGLLKESAGITRRRVYLREKLCFRIEIQFLFP